MADRDVESLKERIKYETEVLKATLLIAVATIGGTISLFLGDATPIRTALASAGILVSLVSVLGVWRQDRAIRILIERIREIE
jgi:uncharacterized membrane-anchored protein